MIHDFDLRWLLILPTLAAIGFMFWVLFNLFREISREHREYAGFRKRRRNRRQFSE
jgi:ABC-type glycerol-3-phosphate transport system permease component